MTIFVSGSLAYDRIMDFPGRFVDHILPEKIHILNVCFMVNGLTERFGGTAGNIAYNLALLEEKSVILATGGRDFGPYREWLTKLDLPLDGIRLIDEEFTAGAYITTDLADNQITGFNPGAMKHESHYRFYGAYPRALWPSSPRATSRICWLIQGITRRSGCPTFSTPASPSRLGAQRICGRWPPGPWPSS